MFTKKTKKYINNISQSIFFDGIGFILSFLIIIIFTNKLGLQEFSLFILLKNLTSVGIAGTFLNFGYRQFVIKKISLYSDSEKNKKKNLIVSKSYFNLFIIIFCISFILLILNNFSGLNFFSFIKDDSFYLLLNLIFLIWIIEIPLYIFSYALEGIQKLKQIKIISFFFNFLFFAGFIIIIYNNFNYKIIFLFFLLTNLTKNLIIVKYYSKFFNFYINLNFLIKIYIFEDKKFFYNNIFGNFLSFIMEFGEKYLVAIFLSIEYVGILEALSKIPKILKALNGFIYGTFLPQTSKHYYKNQVNFIGYFIYNNLNLNILLINLPVIFLSIFSEKILEYFFLNEIAKYYFFFIFLLIPNVTWPILSIFGNLIIGSNRYLKLGNFISLIQIFLKFSIMLLLISDYKLYSVSFGYLANFLLIPIYFFFINKILNDKKTKKNLINYIYNSCLQLSIIFLFMLNDIFFKNFYFFFIIFFISILYVVLYTIYNKNIFIKKFLKRIII